MTTTEDLHERATEAYNAAAERQAARAPLGPRDTSPWRDGIRAVVDLVLAARPALSETEVLRKAKDIYASRVMDGYVPLRLGELAERLEADRAEQEKAAADAAREKLIEQAAQVLHQARDGGPLTAWHGEIAERDARALADAGFLTDPEALCCKYPDVCHECASYADEADPEAVTE